MSPARAAHEQAPCAHCGRSPVGLQLLEHALSAGRAFVVGGGILASTFLLTAAMQPSAEAAAAPVHSCSAPGQTAPGPLAPIELVPLDPPGPPPQQLLAVRGPRSHAVSRRLFAAAPEGAARLTGAGALLARGDAAYRAGHFWTALRRYLLAAEQEPARADAHFGVALARFELMDDRGSRRALRRALDRRPDHPLAHLLLGYLDQLEGHSGSARAHYEQYLLGDPGGSFSSEVRTLLGQL